MAKFDTGKIENFDALTAEEKVAALLELDIPDAVDMSKFVSKDVFDKKASEAANLSKQLKERMTDEEKRKADEDAAREEETRKFTDLEEKYNALLKDKLIAEYTAKFIGMGFEEKLAAETAKAQADGDSESVFKNYQKHQEAREKKIKEDLMNGMKKPGAAGAENKVMTKEEIFKISDPAERQEAIAANLNLFGGE